MFLLKVFEDSELIQEQKLETGSDLSIGRGSDCTLILKGHPGISRNHANLSVSENQVQIKLISTTGKLIHLGKNISDLEISEPGIYVTSIPPYDFHIEMLPPPKPEPEPNTITEETKENTTPSDEASVTDLATSDTYSNDFDQEEHTSTAITLGLEYYIKVFKGEIFEQELLIEGQQWTFGRSPDADVRIKTKKASREHFNIFKAGNTFYVKDLGSSNGTLLNKQQLPANQEIELKSGDYIEVEDYKFIFEIKDPQFEEKVQDIALVEEHLIEEEHENIDDIRSNALVLSDEMVKLRQEGNLSDQLPSIPGKQNKTKFIRLGILALLLGFVGFYYFQSQNNGQEKKQALIEIQRQKQLEKERVAAATDKFNLALRFYNESQFERCILEIDEFLKLDIQTEETSGAMELRNQCDIEKERLQRQKDLEEQKQKQIALKEQVEKLLEGCKPLVEQGTSALKPCLAPAEDLDPSNENISAMLDEAQSIDMEKEKQAANRKAYLAKVAKGKNLFNVAKKHDKHGDWKKAIKAYNKFLKSRYPDPKKLKTTAKRNLATIQSSIRSTVMDATKNSKKHLNAGEYKESILAAQKGLKVNRDDPTLLSTKAEAEKLLKVILRKHYQESIIEEDFGEIGEAKLKWKKILKQGVPGSEYVKKAQNKLKYYEEGLQ